MSDKRAYAFTLTDLVDRLTIAQIKETLFDGPKRDTFTEDLAKTAEDIDSQLADGEVRMTGRMALAVMLMAQCNLHVWKNKDRITAEPENYHILLERAQELNGIRNHVRNVMMAEFGESHPAVERATFLEFSEDRWYRPILDTMESGE